MINPENDEEFGEFGRAAVGLLDLLFPNLYKSVIIVSPSFNIERKSNISPQFNRGDFFVVSSTAHLQIAEICGDVRRFSPSRDVDGMLDSYRYEHAILASMELGVLTAWAQAEYAVVAIRETLLDEYGEWFEVMHAMEVVRYIA